jgi:hypothetical protein
MKSQYLLVFLQSLVKSTDSFCVLSEKLERLAVASRATSNGNRNLTLQSGRTQKDKLKKKRHLPGSSFN